MSKPASWGVAKVWNQSLDVNTQRPYEKRTHIWASEISSSYFDRYHKMRGRKPTTPPNARSLRKFHSGSFTEFVLQTVLARAGVLKSSQEYITYEGGELKVTGKADFTAGGEIKELTDEDLIGFPETFADVAKRTIAHLRKKYPNGLEFMNIEIKSTSGMMFESYLIAPSLAHSLQAFHYALNTNRNTLLVYVSRDDFRMVEYLIKPTDKKLKAHYDNDISNMAKILTLNRKQINNYKEPLLVENDKGKWSKNWKVEYSNYLTDYGFKKPMDYADKASKIAPRINNVIKKLKKYDKITPINELAINDAIEFFPAIQPHLVKLINEWHVNYQPPKKGKK